MDLTENRILTIYQLVYRGHFKVMFSQPPSESYTPRDFKGYTTTLSKGQTLKPYFLYILVNCFCYVVSLLLSISKLLQWESKTSIYKRNVLNYITPKSHFLHLN